MAAQMTQADFQVGIVGAGFSGIVAALRLQESNRDSFVILEQADAPGGTWRDNTYPGCACDVPSNLYSISTAPNPNWSQAYSSQAEILEYLKRVIADHNLGSHIRYNSDVTQLEFLEREGFWRITDRAGKVVTVRSVILGMGPFSRPSWPTILGLETYTGQRLHTARWDHSIDLSGKRVGIIGTGASAVQIVPEIAGQVAHLTVFQRSAAWIGDRMNREIDHAKQEQYQRLPWLQALERNVLYWVMELRGTLFTGNKTVHNFVKSTSLKKLEREVPDPELRGKLTPNYEFGCKRILSSDDYLPCFSRENVTLETDAIFEVTANGIRTANAQSGPTLHEFDVLICATGFEVASISNDMKIIGLNGRELLSEWRERGAMEAYKGSSVAGFPNLNFMLGPNTGLGHSSMISIMEAQANYIMGYTELLEQNANAYLDVKAEIQREHNAQLQTQFIGTVWASGCKSWYINSSGKNTTLYPRLVQAFRNRTRGVNPLEYELVKLS
jgi:cation diffusion facilitator CzcD-associated flavoprotein CzcO